MTFNFCTLFNSNYLSRGLGLYQSLKTYCSDFNLYVFAFDAKSYDILKALNYSNLIPISLKDFEDSELIKIKPTRSAAEYCWTCTPSTILYAIKNFKLDHCTYVDADMMFFSDPKVLIDEMDNRSVLITEHRYTKDYDQAIKSGKYCVQFVTVKNDVKGMAIVEWWRNACIDWCYARHEDGKFGDQKYLDDWTTRFDGVHELQHLGGGIAPWNVQQYNFTKNDNVFSGKQISTGKTFNVVFFHFHALKYYTNGMVSLSDEGYEIKKEVIEYFYKPYIRLLETVKKEINKIDDSFDPNGANSHAPYDELGFSMIKKIYLEGVKSSKKNIFGIKVIKRIKHHYFYRVSKFINA